VDGRASASKVEKKAKKVEIFQYFGDFFSNFEIQKLDVCACLTRLIKPDKKNNFGYTLVGSLTRTLRPLNATK
jgi:hypothetical protein